MKYQELKKSKLVKHLIKDVSKNADWLQFFLMFSRFEYALKRAGYIKPRKFVRNNVVEADWDKFGKDVEQKLKESSSIRLIKAIRFLIDDPPYKQYLNQSNELDWQQPHYSTCDIQNIINTIKIVRNNLFHGGKYPTMPVHSPSRDIELVRNSAIVLKYLIYSSPEVKRRYFEPLE